MSIIRDAFVTLHFLLSFLLSFFTFLPVILSSFFHPHLSVFFEWSSLSLPHSPDCSWFSVSQDGDFLVRESQGTAGQYVLTGMQNNTKKHLLLVDPEGVVSHVQTNCESQNIWILLLMTSLNDQHGCQDFFYLLPFFSTVFYPWKNAHSLVTLFQSIPPVLVSWQLSVSQVRTKSRTFDSVSHLIIYHRDNELPIVSAESALLLRNPVLRNPR